MPASEKSGSNASKTGTGNLNAIFRIPDYMSVYIRFEPAGLSGVVPEGTYLIDAARRMGISLPTDCRGSECTSCLVSIAQGQSLLSPPTEAEKMILGYQGLATEQRLACQTMIVNAGELLVRVMPEREVDKTETAKDPESPSGELPLEKLKAEAMKVLAALDSVRDKSISIAEKMFDRFETNERLKRKQKLELRRPPEHRQQHW